ncbi:MAG: 2-hydroxy-3-oxopropionate reductase [Chloroflexi bacterium]|nr:2-hydroxy-3-oxopropionate reductase [Chloroflexota bacterium]
MPTIGFIGLGIMGKPMARNLIKAGYPLIVGNRSQAAVHELVAEGARNATTAQAIAAQSDVVITMLPDSPDVELVVAGATGVLAGARAGMLLIDMSTISPIVARKLAADALARGVTMLDAPVSGGEAGAINAALSIMVGGTAEGVERAMPVFQALGKNIVHIGEAGAGQVAKAANQVVVALTIAAVSEALTLAKNAGVDAAKVRQALLGGFAQSRILDVHGQRILDRNFKPGFRIRLHEKDLSIALATGKEYGVALLLTGIVQQYMNSLKANGQGDLDHSGLVTLIEQLSAKPS